MNTPLRWDSSSKPTSPEYHWLLDLADRHQSVLWSSSSHHSKNFHLMTRTVSMWLLPASEKANVQILSFSKWCHWGFLDSTTSHGKWIPTFKGTFCLHLQGPSILLRLLGPWKWRHHCPSKCLETFTQHHSVTSQKSWILSKEHYTINHSSLQYVICSIILLL